MNFSLQVKEELFSCIGIKIGQLYWSINEDKDINIFGSVFSTTGEAASIPFRVAGNMCDCSGNILYTLHDFSEHTLDPICYEVFHVFCADISRFIDLDSLSYVELFPVRA